MVFAFSNWFIDFGLGLMGMLSEVRIVLVISVSWVLDGHYWAQLFCVWGCGSLTVIRNQCRSLENLQNRLVPYESSWFNRSLLFVKKEWLILFPFNLFEESICVVPIPFKLFLKLYQI